METVYALHDFVGENEDEISFYIGEPISVIEKDELYNDGWWQGRSVRGDTGLFPSNYVSVEKPLPVAHDDDDDDDDTDLDIPPPTAFLNGHESIYCDSTMSPVFPDVKVPSIPDIHIDTRIQQSVSEQQRISITESSLRPSVDSTESYSQLASPDLAFPAPPADLSNGNKRNETIRRPEVDSWHISGWSPAQDNLEPIPELPSQYRKGLNQNANTTATTSPSKADITKALPNSPPISSSPVKLLHAERTSSAPPSNEQISTVKANVMPSSAVNVGSPGHSRTVSQPIISTASSSSSSSPAMVAKRASVTRASLELRNSSVEINAPQPHLPLPQPLTSFRQSPDSTVSAQSTPEEEESNRRYHASSRTSVASDSHSKMANPSITSPVTSSIDVTAETRHKQPTMAEATIEGQHINEQHNEPQLQSVEDDPSSWNMQQVSNWLESVGLSSVIPEFQKHEITGDVLLDLNITMLKELDISSFGRRYHIMQAIATLRSGGNGIPTTPSDSGSASRSGRLNNAPSHSQLDNVLTDSRASIRSASSNHSQQALSRGSSTRQELYDNMNAATASNSFSHRRAPPSSVVPPRRSPSRPLSTMSFGSDAPLAAAVYSAGLEGSFPSSPPRADNQLSPVRESQDMSRMSNDNNNNYRDTLPRGSNGYQIQQQQQHNNSNIISIIKGHLRCQLFGIQMSHSNLHEVSLHRVTVN
ncbi:hypothetical protein BDF19DRAFT_422135 [Syncephalis fuscata]|nr:hypothetical protein BDF19DRAFT_422135 [Syncephalis fuscata]